MDYRCWRSSPLGLEPQRLHLVEIGAFRLPPTFGEALFDMGEAALELGVGPAQGRLGVDVEVTGQVNGGEQKVTELFGQLFRRAIADLRFDLGDFLPQLGYHRANVVPVEPDFSGLLLEFQGAQECGQRQRTPLSAPVAASARMPADSSLGARELLVGLDPAPEGLHRLGIEFAGITEDMRMPPDKPQ